MQPKRQATIVTQKQNQVNPSIPAEKKDAKVSDDNIKPQQKLDENKRNTNDVNGMSQAPAQLDIRSRLGIDAHLPFLDVKGVKDTEILKQQIEQRYCLMYLEIMSKKENVQVLDQGEAAVEIHYLGKHIATILKNGSIDIIEGYNQRDLVNILAILFCQDFTMSPFFKKDITKLCEQSQLAKLRDRRLLKMKTQYVPFVLSVCKDHPDAEPVTSNFLCKHMLARSQSLSKGLVVKWTDKTTSKWDALKKSAGLHLSKYGTSLTRSSCFDDVRIGKQNEFTVPSWLNDKSKKTTSTELASFEQVKA